MMEVKAAYDRLISVADFMKDTIDREVSIDGVLMSQFGLGLGPRINGRDCEDCGRKGFHEHIRPQVKACPTCRGIGYGYAKICRPCNGTGKFTQAKSKRVVDC